MPMEATQGIRYGDSVVATGAMPGIGVGEEMSGRILDGLGFPLDGLPAPRVTEMWSLDGTVRQPMERMTIKEPLQTGVRVLDGMLTVGRGQRIGVFGGSGVGKSTLLGMMTRGTAADITVVGLVGERGREVREFVEDSLGEEGQRRSVVLVSTSDQSPLLRMRAAMAATSVAEFYASRGRHVLLVLDSLTRYAMAAREVGLAAGEPPASKGYTPSVFAKLAKLVERAGKFQSGSITAFYTVLMEGDDQQDPVVDAVRSLLDGHVVLSRSMAAEGWYPPVNVLDSLSRLMPAITLPEHRAQAAVVRRLLAAHVRSEDLVRIGAYKAGMDEYLDRALRAMPLIRNFLEQRSDECVAIQESIAQLNGLDL
jgi:flagellum-specific ATP synthase